LARTWRPDHHGTIVFMPLLPTTFIIDLVLRHHPAGTLRLRPGALPVRGRATAAGRLRRIQALLRDRRRIRPARRRADTDVRIDIPRPVSPFNWTVFVSDAHEHRFAHVNLSREAPRAYQPGDGFVAMLDAPYQPLAAARWESRPRYGGNAAEEALGRAAWQSPALGFLRWFAERPALEAITEGSTCAWFIDLRFVTRDGWVPFRFGACRQAPPWQTISARTGQSSPIRQRRACHRVSRPSYGGESTSSVHFTAKRGSCADSGRKCARATARIPVQGTWLGPQGHRRGALGRSRFRRNRSSRPL
jgi:hypothetical protein